MRRLLLVPVLILATVLGFAPPAHAAPAPPFPLHGHCTVAGRLFLFTAFIRYTDEASSKYVIHRVSWSTQPSFKPSQLGVYIRKNSGGNTRVQVWGGTTGSLRDVGATGDTGSPWGTTQYSVNTNRGVFARVYLNPDATCAIPVMSV
ncbi:hypothetical protein [Actinoplanes sp. URMC 104]|uniref:hypothetical protein n=1 Tax=Actinoplanes sp. URMC 104 TaxID=3423409 RepID=UPI003F198D45